MLSLVYVIRELALYDESYKLILGMKNVFVLTDDH